MDHVLCCQETNAIHVNVGAGSYLEVNIPMTVGENGKCAFESAAGPYVQASAHVLLVKGQTVSIWRNASTIFCSLVTSCCTAS